MELSPEEKKIIYEEEKARLEAQEKAKKELKAKKTKQGWLGCLGLIAVIFIIALIGGLFTSGDKTKKSSSTSTSSSTIDLKASVKFDGTQFVISNNDNFDWTNVKLEVNSGLLRGGFVLKAQRMSAGEIYTVGAMQFAKGDGTRFNPFTTKAQKFSIWCDTPKGKGFWYGGWE
ncbi:MAG: hypothetical protein JSW13_01435 [Candidatus Aerophobus sp.]|nr:MAG: hypothetical protein JSW13_01435 [Candidatus Aerophobus sp.]